MHSVVKVALAVVVLGSMLFAPDANAVPDEDVPLESFQTEGTPDAGDTILAQCAVSGQLVVDGAPPPLWVAHDQYALVSAIFECLGTPGHPSDTFNVGADGATDGRNVSVYDEGDDSDARRAVCGASPHNCLAEPQLQHGAADEAVSWSHSANYRNEGGCTGDNANRGNIWADGVLFGGSGWVKFIRAGSGVVAWGAFCNDVLAGDAFTAVLVVTPTASSDLFDVSGFATIWED